MTVFLESPDLQFEDLGGDVEEAFNLFQFDSNSILQGAVAGGDWKVTLLASSGAAGWEVRFTQVRISLGQCVYD